LERTQADLLHCAGKENADGLSPLVCREVLDYYAPGIVFSITTGPGEIAMLEYKVVEVSTVSEDILEGVLNEWTAKGWRYDGMQFAMRDSSRRPSMAFVLFTRESEHEGVA
jgi:hypothetical protein